MNWLRKFAGLSAGAAVVLAFASIQNRAETPKVRNTSYTSGDERVLRHETVVDAGLDEVWKAFSTAEGLRSFAAPVVEFELKTGGKFHSNYKWGSKAGDPGTIYNSVLCFIPRKMVAFKIGLTEAFPSVPREAGTLFAVVEIEPADDAQKSRVAISMLGWGTGPDWDKVYQHFDWGNSYTLGKLRERFITGPVNWQQVALKNSMKEK